MYHQLNGSDHSSAGMDAAVLSAFRLNPDTYLTDPPCSDDSSTEKWKSFSECFLLEDYKDDIHDLLYYTPGFKSLCEKLGTFCDRSLLLNLPWTVPEKVDEKQFWMRYFFKEAELLKEQEQRKRLLNAVQMNKVEDDDLFWSDEEDEDEKKNVSPKKQSDEPADVPPVADTSKEKDDPISTETKEESDGERKSEEEATESTSSFEVVSMPPESRKISKADDPSPTIKSEKSDEWGEDWE